MESLHDTFWWTSAAMERLLSAQKAGRGEGENVCLYA
jgi:hypothetical protein